MEKKTRKQTSKLWKCCREIRIQGGAMKKGGIYSGFNTLSDQEEFWKVIKIAKDFNNHILERQFNPN